MVALTLAHYETFNCTIIQWRKETMACAALTARLLKPWKPISDPVQCSKWAGQGTFFFFRNGSLACNIIRNTLGHHLIFLQCDHMRKFVLMRRAQVWLVTLSLSLRVLLSLSVCCIAVSPIRHDLASCSTSSSRVSKTNPAAFSYGTCKHAAYILHLHEWGFPLPVKSTSLNPYRGNNPHQGWSSQTFSF